MTIAGRALQLGVAALAVAWCLASTAHAQREDGPRATDRHRTIVGGGLGGRWSNDDTSVPWPSFREWYAYATPQLTYFVRDGIGIGLSLGAMYGNEQVRSYWLDLELRDVQVYGGISTTLELPLGRRTSVLAIPSLSYVRTWRRVGSWIDKSPSTFPGRNIQNQTVLAQSRADFEYDTHALRGSLILLLVVHASDAVLVGFGPEVWIDRALGELTEFRRETLISVGASTWLGLSF